MRWCALGLLAGCLSVDPFIHNGIPCDQVGPDTCREDTVFWDQVCLPCEDPYDWEESFDWFDTMLDEGDTVRTVSNESVVQATVAMDDGVGMLDTYFIPSHGDDPALANTTVLYNHGNFAGIEHYVPRLQVLHELGYNVLVWDYRGYGKSQPTTYPTVDEFLADARAIRAWAAGVVPDASRIILYAYSVGGIPAIEASVADPGCALIFEAAFTGAGAILRGKCSD